MDWNDCRGDNTSPWVWRWLTTYVEFLTISPHLTCISTDEIIQDLTVLLTLIGWSRTNWKICKNNLLWPAKVLLATKQLPAESHTLILPKLHLPSRLMPAMPSYSSVCSVDTSRHYTYWCRKRQWSIQEVWISFRPPRLANHLSEVYVAWHAKMVTWSQNYEPQL